MQRQPERSALGASTPNNASMICSASRTENNRKQRQADSNRSARATDISTYSAMS